MKKHIIFLLSMLIIASCQLYKNTNKPTYNAGNYNISKYHNTALAAQDSTVIYGYVKDISTKKVLTSALVKFGCSKVTTGTDGYYRFKEHTLSVESFLLANFIGFRSIETEHSMLSKGDSINVNFYLSQDDRPLIDCQ
jgi:hypothetical protein